MPKIVVEFMLERHPKELPLISMFGHVELWDEKCRLSLKSGRRKGGASDGRN